MERILDKLARALPTPVGVAALLVLLQAPTTGVAGEATLSWDQNTEPELAGYMVYFGTSSGVYGTPLDAGTQTTYTVTGLAIGPSYFAVTAYNTAGTESTFSNEATKIIVDTAPPVTPSPSQDQSPPADIQGFRASAGDGEIVLSWTTPNDPDFAGVRIRVRTDGTFPQNQNDGTLVGDFSGGPAETGTFHHVSLPNGITYRYAAFSYDAHGNYSHTVYASATPNAPHASDPTADGPISGGFGCGSTSISGGSAGTAPPTLDLFLLVFAAWWLGLRRKRVLTTVISVMRSACGSVSRSSRPSVCLTPRVGIGIFHGLAAPSCSSRPGLLLLRWMYGGKPLLRIRPAALQVRYA